MLENFTPDSLAWRMVLPNLTYLVIACMAILVSLRIGWQQIDKLTPFQIGEELQTNNMAVVVLLSSMFLGISFAVGLAVSAAIG